MLAVHAGEEGRAIEQGWRCRAQLSGVIPPLGYPPVNHAHNRTPAGNGASAIWPCPSPSLAAGMGFYECYKSDITQFGADMVFIRII